MSDADLLAPTTTEDAPAVEEPAQPAITADDDAAFDAAIEAQAIDIPDGDKLVPLSAVTGAREKIKSVKAERDTYKAQAERAPQLEQELQQLREQLNQALPGHQAYQALLAAQQVQQPPAQAEDTTELEELAKDLDLYEATTGKPDIEKARKIHNRQMKLAESVARQHVAPIENRAIAQQSHIMLQRAMLTEVGGAKADPGILQQVWKALDPQLTATEEGAKQALLSALGYSHAMGKIGTKPAPVKAQELPEPLLTEKAGGKEGAYGFTMTDSERRVAREMGITDKEYAETAAKMPWRK
jgi:hypothetical protein